MTAPNGQMFPQILVRYQDEKTDNIEEIKGQVEGMSDDPLAKLKQIGHCLDRLGDDTGSLKIRREMGQVCFLIINTDSVFRQNLGFSPLHDAYHLGKTFRKMGFEVYFTTTSFLNSFCNFFEVLLCSTSTHLLIFSSGHGNERQHKATSNWTTSDVCYHSLVFRDGFFDDSDFISFIDKYRRGGCRITFVTDCTEAGSIWNVGEGVIHEVTVPRDIVSISSMIDDEFESIQKNGTGTGIRQFLRGSDVSLGLFVKVLCKNVQKKPDINGEELQFNVRKILKTHGYQFVLGSSTPGLLSRPLF
jgi:hypothetical protein